LHAPPEFGTGGIAFKHLVKRKLRIVSGPTRWGRPTTSI